MKMKNIVDNKIFEQMEKVRKSGEANMMSRDDVQYVADSLNCCDLVCEIEDRGKRGYFSLLDEFSEYLKTKED